MYRYLAPLLMLILAGCAAAPDGPPPRGSEAEIASLSRAIQALDQNVDPTEAARAARISYDYSHELALAYQIVDRPLVHNAKVNRGEKPRGLCWHWAEDMENRLSAENFQTLAMHRGIANSDSLIRIDHSSAIISARGAPMAEGIVLDPWRQGGVLYWGAVRDDRSYPWKPRMQVLREQGRINYVDAQGVPVAMN